MTIKDIGIVIAVVTLLFTAARTWQHGEEERALLRHRIEVLERIMVQEHPAYSTTIWWQSGN